MLSEGGMVCRLVSPCIFCMLVSPCIFCMLVSPGVIVVSAIPLVVFMPECREELQAAKNKPDNRMMDPAPKLVFMTFIYNMCCKHCAQRPPGTAFSGSRRNIEY